VANRGEFSGLDYIANLIFSNNKEHTNVKLGLYKNDLLAFSEFSITKYKVVFQRKGLYIARLIQKCPFDFVPLKSRW